MCSPVFLTRFCTLHHFIQSAAEGRREGRGYGTRNAAQPPHSSENKTGQRMRTETVTVIQPQPQDASRYPPPFSSFSYLGTGKPRFFLCFPSVSVSWLVLLSNSLLPPPPAVSPPPSQHSQKPSPPHPHRVDCGATEAV